MFGFKVSGLIGFRQFTAQGPGLPVVPSFFPRRFTAQGRGQRHGAPLPRSERPLRSLQESFRSGQRTRADIVPAFPAQPTSFGEIRGHCGQCLKSELL